MKHMFGNSVEQRSFPKGIRHNFYIYGEITHDLNDYVDMITCMDMAMEEEEIHLFINTPGGSLDTTISIVHAMMRTNGTVICHADGLVASAGTILFFAGHNYFVYPYASFMLHDGASGNVGKLNENLKSAVASSNLLSKLAHDVYEPYFTKEEVDSILEGRDLYCTAEEIVERIANAFEEESNEIDDEATSEIDVKFPVDTCVEIRNSSLKTHGQSGVVDSIVSDSIRRVELESGKFVNVHIKNLVKL